MREWQAESSIIPPDEGSEEATEASSIAANEPVHEGFDEDLEDAFYGINWDRLRGYIKPFASQRGAKSWIYRHGYRVALLKDPNRIFFICRYCHRHKRIDAGCGGIYETTRSTSTAQRHCEESKPGHDHHPPGKLIPRVENSALRRLISSGRIDQDVANELSGFNTQRFRLALVSWLVENNHPLSELETPAFRQLMATANPEAEAAMWASHNSVTRYVLRLYD